MIIVRHKVKDYAKWRPLSTAHVESRRRRVFTHPRIMRSADELRRDCDQFDEMDMKKAKAFADFRRISKETMMKAGVVDQPNDLFSSNQI